MTETKFTARFFNEDGGRSNQTVAPYKELLINTMKHLLLIFDDWDGFEIETNGKTIYKYLKNYNYDTERNANHSRLADERGGLYLLGHMGCNEKQQGDPRNG